MIPDYLKDCIVTDVYTVEQFLDRYYKEDRYKGRGKDYEKQLLQSYRNELKEQGYCCISHHNNTTGKFICFTNDKNFKEQFSGK